jgi:hypothetical protein
MHSVEVIESVLATHSRVALLRLFTYSSRTKLQERVEQMQKPDEALVARAIATKERTGIQFWDALLTEASNSGSASKHLLSEVLFHQRNQNYHLLEPARLRDFVASVKGDLLAINSEVRMSNGSFLHIPMLDLKLRSKRSNDALARECVSALGVRGVLLDSGRSYHFIGTELVSSEEMLDLLAKFILLHPISDKAWAVHQILERSASLRINEKNGHVPTKIGVVA